MNLIILDIDGTLVDSMKLEEVFFPQAVKETLGISDMNTDWSSYTNPTDSGIIRETMREQLGKLCHPEDTEKCRMRFVELLAGHLDEYPEALPPIPGAHQFIAYLENHKSHAFAVATAGWRFTSELKLTAAGFDFDEWIMYTCCEYEYKKEAMKAAHMTARQKLGADFDAVIHIGDSRSDLRFANELGYDFVGLGEEFSHANIWGVEGIKDFTDIRLVEGKINRAIRTG